MATPGPENGSPRICARCEGKPPLGTLFGAWLECPEEGCQALLCSEECLDLHMLFHLDYEKELDKLF
jgi:hypothetical protein